MSQETYWEHVTDAASIVAFHHDRATRISAFHQDDAVSSTVSAEAVAENSSLLDFKSFAREYPEKLFPLLAKLRVEFQEIFIEYYLLEKSQYFIGPTHGFIQTRAWQTLRIIEQAIGSMIVLGTNPGADILRPILIEAGVEITQYGSLTDMILLYASTQSYAAVAKQFGSPVPAVRKIFRPIIARLLESKNLKDAAVGAYLRSLTHQASLTGIGLSKRCRARLSRVRKFKFVAPPSDESPLLNFGPIASLRDTPWTMLEISSEHRMTQIFPLLQQQGSRLFKKKAAQIFAPLDANGELEFGYILARSTSPTLTRSLTRVRGISEIAGNYSSEGEFINAITVPNADIQKLISNRAVQKNSNSKVGDFVEIQTGVAARYHGTITASLGEHRTVEINFPSGRQFIVSTDSTALRVFPNVPQSKRCFWGQTS